MQKKLVWYCKYFSMQDYGILIKLYIYYLQVPIVDYVLQW
jgi:hypothetical protein